ncbi:MAG: hypothetical protein JWQ90_1698 [Hydrocarboniphaga sp.]|uniref:cellulase family glycosylhydrolase n=1 Tax=Hydrocarboniphaga sp. TaxID=2033016 RepID=UPI002617472A|nr:cellulase family glycosylhydrolase [Hydrocarboniphaga sp.]MDB5969248.1 hypothetical protein [Hydrocarboniphaga sp.]
MRNILLTGEPRALVGALLSSVRRCSPRTGIAALVLATLTLLISGTALAQTSPQQLINSFSPTSGPAGTVVTLKGSGFTGSNAAWVGDAHNAKLKVVSDTVAKITVPPEAHTGAVAILNAAHAAFTASSFTITDAAALPQQKISAISPKSGPAGTVVTVTGKGFTGSTSAWVGSAHDGGLSVISDTQALVTVPADASSGQVAILNAEHSALSAQTFKLTTTAAPLKQQTISGISPLSGPVGTVVRVSGTGFTGSNSAWVGNAQNASLTVISDTQANITVPAAAASGAVSILSPQYSAVSSSTFNVTAAQPGTQSLRVLGNRFVDANGATVQLRGVNYSGFEFVAVQGWNPSDPSGAQAGQAGGPKWSAIQAWKANTIRIPLNEASWLGYSCTDTSGVVHNPDPGGNYQSAVKTQVDQAIAAGLYVIIDLHWTAPGNACPMLQTQMADADHSLAFWTSVAGMFKTYPGVLFELFNEPFMNFEFSGDSWSYMMQGTGGSFTGYPATSSSGNWTDVKQPWAIASYQAMIDAVRATGAGNVLLIGTMQYSQEFSGWLSHKPTDSLNQIAAVWHAYPTYGNAWGSDAYAQPNFAPAVYTDMQAILAAGIPVIATETGDQNTPGTVGAPLVSNITAWADQNGVSVVGWAWDVWGVPDNVLIKDVDGTPTDGYGQVYRSWLLAH